MEKEMWVARQGSDGALGRRPQIGNVLEAYEEGLFLDIVLFAHDGKKIGRESPPCRGPRGFEPCCPAEDWTPIEPPDFSYIGDKFFYGDYLRKLPTHPRESNEIEEGSADPNDDCHA